MIAISKAADLNYLKQGGHVYWASFFCKGSLLQDAVNQSIKNTWPSGKYYKHIKIVNETSRVVQIVVSLTIITDHMS
jgi:hypothetical protein